MHLKGGMKAPSVNVRDRAAREQLPGLANMPQSMMQPLSECGIDSSTAGNKTE